MKLVDLAKLTPEGVSHDPAILKRVLLRNGEVPRVTQLARATFEPGQTARLHAHPDMWEVFVCESGSGVAIVDDVAVDLHGGVCMVVEPGEEHEVSNRGAEPLVITVLGIAGT